MWVLAVLMLGTVIEISLFVTVGGWLGLWATLAIVAGTAVAGVTLLRRQGTQGLRDAQRGMAQLRSPLAPLAHGALRMMAAVLLIMPGFMTDVVGLMLLIPPVRGLIIALVAARVAQGVASTTFATFRGGSHDAHPDARGQNPDARGQERAIDGEFHEIDPEDSPKGGGSGWTRP